MFRLSPNSKTLGDAMTLSLRAEGGRSRPGIIRSKSAVVVDLLKLNVFLKCLSAMHGLVFHSSNPHKCSCYRYEQIAICPYYYWVRRSMVF